MAGPNRSPIAHQLGDICCWLAFLPADRLSCPAIAFSAFSHTLTPLPMSDLPLPVWLYAASARGLHLHRSAIYFPEGEKCYLAGVGFH